MLTIEIDCLLVVEYFLLNKWIHCNRKSLLFYRNQNHFLHSPVETYPNIFWFIDRSKCSHSDVISLDEHNYRRICIFSHVQIVNIAKDPMFGNVKIHLRENEMPLHFTCRYLVHFGISKHWIRCNVHNLNQNSVFNRDKYLFYGKHSYNSFICLVAKWKFYRRHFQ